MTKNIQLWNPFENLIPINPLAPMARRNPFGGLFEDFFNGENMKNALTSDFGFKIVDHKDIREYQFALPGIPSDKIDVQVTGNLLSVSVDYKDKDFQRVYRSNVTLPSVVDPEKITSSYKDGLLSINVPSSSEPTVKIPVTSGKSDDSPAISSSDGKHRGAGEDNFEKDLSTSASDEEAEGASGINNLPPSTGLKEPVGAGVTEGGHYENATKSESKSP